MFFLSAIFGLGVFIVFTLVSIGIGSTTGNTVSKSLIIGWSAFGILLTFFVTLSVVKSYFTDPMDVDKEDIYGTYVIDRDYFPGKNADWQYNHYRFEITKSDSIKFTVIDGNNITDTYVSKIEFTSDNRPHIRIVNDYRLEKETHPILRENPTLYRKPFSFYYVFNSPVYGNMFFTKGEYKAIK